MGEQEQRTFRYRVYPEHRFGVVVWNERVTGEDVATAAETLFTSEEWQPGFSHLWDGRLMQQFVLDIPGAVKVGNVLQKLNDRVGFGKAAIVVVRHVHILGVQLLVALGNVEDRDVCYFHTIGEALNWLDIPPDLIEI